MKKTLAVLLSLMLTCLLAFPANAAQVGDIDNDRAVTAADARTALRIAVELESAIPGSARFIAADADGDGAVTAADARLILRAAVGLETLRPWPADDTPAGKLTSKEVYRLARAYTFEIHVETDDYAAIGSGFAIGEDGLIVTNYHVIADATSITVNDFEGNDYAVAEVVAFDRHYDLAILRVNAVLTPAKLDATDYETGDTVYTLGSSNGLTGTFANGVISNASRVLEDYNPDMHYIQTNAPISGGNSGGPLIDEMGRVIGVNTMSDESGQNLNFAVPAEYILLLDRSHPETLEEFSETEANRRDFDLAFGTEHTTLAPYGTGAWAFLLDARKDATLVCECGDPNLKVGFTHKTNDEVGHLTVSALGETKNAVITVYVKEAPEVKKTITVSVEPGAKKVHPATGGLPDLGAILGCVPSSVSFQSAYDVYPMMTYRAADLPAAYRSGDAARSAYESALFAAGFAKEEESSTPLGTQTVRYYVNQKTGVMVGFAETKILGRLSEINVVIY